MSSTSSSHLRKPFFLGLACKSLAADRVSVENNHLKKPFFLGLAPELLGGGRLSIEHSHLKTALPLCGIGFGNAEPNSSGEKR